MTSQQNMARLWLVRHGQTTLNAARIVQGRSDGPLTEQGRQSLEPVRNRLRSVPFSAVYVSPAPRAVATARLLLVPHPQVPQHVAPGLRELDFGRYDGGPEDAFASLNDPVGRFTGLITGTDARLPGGESGAELCTRVATEAWRMLRAQRPGGDALVVAHGISLLALLGMLGTAPAYPLRNASVTRVLVNLQNGRGRLEDEPDLAPPGLDAPDLRGIDFPDLASYVSLPEEP